MKDIEVVRLWQELLQFCEVAKWDVETNDRYDRFVLVPRERPTVAVLRTNSLLECIGFVGGYLEGKRA